MWEHSTPPNTVSNCRLNWHKWNESWWGNEPLPPGNVGIVWTNSHMDQATAGNSRRVQLSRSIVGHLEKIGANLGWNYLKRSYTMEVKIKGRSGGQLLSIYSTAYITKVGVLRDSHYLFSTPYMEFEWFLARKRKKLLAGLRLNKTENLFSPYPRSESDINWYTRAPWLTPTVV
jgi:hypothetical protein